MAKFKCSDGIYTVLRNGKTIAMGATAGEAITAITADALAVNCLGLRLTYTEGNLPANDLAAWNTFFDLPANGTAFDSMKVIGDEVTLFNGAGITLKASLFRTSATLLKIEDDVDCVVAIAGGRNLGALSLCSALTTVVLNGVITVAEEGLFDNPLLTSLSLTDCTTLGTGSLKGATSLATLTLPALTSAGANSMEGLTSLVSFTCATLLTCANGVWYGCTSLTTLLIASATAVGNSILENCTALTTANLSSCTNLGGTAGDNSVFLNIIGNLVTVTIPIAQQTIDAGNPDGDLVYLAANNTATINYI
jgi:hypothetical protein